MILFAGMSNLCRLFKLIKLVPSHLWWSAKCRARVDDAQTLHCALRLTELTLCGVSYFAMRVYNTISPGCISILIFSHFSPCPPFSSRAFSRSFLFCWTIPRRNRGKNEDVWASLPGFDAFHLLGTRSSCRMEQCSVISTASGRNLDGKAPASGMQCGSRDASHSRRTMDMMRCYLAVFHTTFISLR